MLNLYEWICKEYGDCANTSEAAKNMILSSLEPGVHNGECTNQNCMCSLCLAECMLEEYHNYVIEFNRNICIHVQQQ